MRPTVRTVGFLQDLLPQAASKFHLAVARVAVAAAMMRTLPQLGVNQPLNHQGLKDKLQGETATSKWKEVCTVLLLISTSLYIFI